MNREEEDGSFGALYGRTLLSGSNTTKMIRDRQYFSLRQTFLADPIEYDDGFQELLEQTWTIWAVSTLYGFRYDNEVQFKIYAKTLREAVCSVLKEDVLYDAKFSVIENLGPKPNSTDAPAIKIELNATSGTMTKCIYKGILISWRTQLAEQNNEKSVHLPLLLCRGTQSAMKAVHSIISHMFDCIIVTLPATDNDLKWLLPINLIPATNAGKKWKSQLVFLEYVVPELSISDSILVKFKTADLQELWTTLSKSYDDEGNELTIKVEHVEKFFETLHIKMLKLGNMQLGLCLLQKLSLPFLTISGNRMKAMNTQALTDTLLFLNEKAVAVLYSLHFETTSLNSSVA